MLGYYILKGKTPVQVSDVLEWGEWFEKANRFVKQTKIGHIRISTIFLGLDHSFGRGKPLLFETMIFGGEHNLFKDRYATWDEAEEGHEAACKKVEQNKLQLFSTN